MAETLADAAERYASMGWAVFPLRPRGKEPRTKNGVKDATTDLEQIRAFWAAFPDSNIGIAMGEPSGGLVAIDVDEDGESGKDGMAAVRAWERGHGELPETATALTGRGGTHMLYRMGGVKNSVNAELAVDIRSTGGYIVAPPSIHPNGTPYAWEFDPEDYPVAEADANVRAFVASVQPAKAERRKFERRDEVGEGGRNDYLYRFGCGLRAKSIPDDAIRLLVEQRNESDCKPPLTSYEVGKIVESVLSLPEGMSEEAASRPAPQSGGDGNKRKRFQHNIVARRLIDEFGACRIDGMPAVRIDGRCKVGWQAVDAAILRLHDDATRNNQNEVHHYLMTVAPERTQAKPSLIGFENGVLDVDTLELRPWNDEDLIPNIVPHRWNPDAEDPGNVVSSTLMKMACGDVGMGLNLTEVIGLCMYRNSRHFPYCPVLIGAGSNGKSTYIGMLRSVIGRENMSALQPREIGQRFQAAHLLGKLANLGDDISCDYIDGDGCAIIKKVATGDDLYTDVKGGEGFVFTPYATMVFSANKFPRLGDSSDGMMRRLFPIEFNARFRRTDPDYDPLIADKLASEEACEYLCRLGVDGLRSVITQGGMTPNEASRRMADEIKTDNNSVLAWIEDCEIEATDIVGRTRREVYEMYQDWCQSNGYSNVTSRNMTGTLFDKWHISLCQQGHVIHNGARKSVRVFGFAN